mmetsp:Transcript_43186/g.99564  ORF Transcript_43186/g.99564 Transcript_43186/m.99564 type:complete len:81 (-) Transcript_43186:17-259(-)
MPTAATAAQSRPAAWDWLGLREAILTCGSAAGACALTFKFVLSGRSSVVAGNMTTVGWEARALQKGQEVCALPEPALPLA